MPNSIVSQHSGTTEASSADKQPIAVTQPANQDKQHLILALDYGVKKMGMALGNTLTQDARAFEILSMNNGQPDWDNLLGIIDKWQITQVIVGLPLNMDGSNSMLSKRAHKFARRLAHRLGEAHLAVEVLLFDERLTSIEARQLAWDNGWIKDERDPIDDIAASLLLTTFFACPAAAQSLL